MRFFLLALLLPVLGTVVRAEHTIAIVGLMHGHVWGTLKTVTAGQTAKLVGVAETEPELIAEAKKRGVADNLFYSDYNKMLDETKPEIVWTFVENNRHVEIAKACAKRGIHVMFEKPLASTAQEAAEIRDVARKSHIYVLTNYQMAWWPSEYTAKRLVDAGEIGKVWRLRGVVGHGGPGGPTGLNKYFFTWLTDPVQNGGGSLVDFGCYNALWNLWIMGKPTKIYAQTNQLRPAEFPKVEDNATMLFWSPGGVGIYEASWDLPRSFQDLEIFGDKGSITVTREKVEMRKGRNPAEEVPITPLAPEASEPIAAMVHAIETKTEPGGMVGLDISVQVVQLIDAAKQSVKTSRAVEIK
jgi:predicted dehydrogenase